jgi:aspartyl-tRNA(Asn)/glutamyl-tRNA(Gln) amidotransferase subunit B
LTHANGNFKALWAEISDPAPSASTSMTRQRSNAAVVAEYKAGKDKAFNSLVGKVMAATKGKANPAQVNAILKQRLGR